MWRSQVEMVSSGDREDLEFPSGAHASGHQPAGRGLWFRGGRGRDSRWIAIVLLPFRHRSLPTTPRSLCPCCGPLHARSPVTETLTGACLPSLPLLSVSFTHCSHLLQTQLCKAPRVSGSGAQWSELEKPYAQQKSIFLISCFPSMTCSTFI